MPYKELRLAVAALDMGQLLRALDDIANSIRVGDTNEIGATVDYTYDWQVDSKEGKLPMMVSILEGVE